MDGTPDEGRTVERLRALHNTETSVLWDGYGRAIGFRCRCPECGDVTTEAGRCRTAAYLRHRDALELVGDRHPADGNGVWEHVVVADGRVVRRIPPVCPECGQEAPCMTRRVLDEEEQEGEQE